jgi:hypothetical protein
MVVSIRVWRRAQSDRQQKGRRGLVRDVNVSRSKAPLSGVVTEGVDNGVLRGLPPARCRAIRHRSDRPMPGSRYWRVRSHFR